jgi:hypothetical protein
MYCICILWAYSNLKIGDGTPRKSEFIHSARSCAPRTVTCRQSLTGAALLLSGTGRFCSGAPHAAARLFAIAPAAGRGLLAGPLSPPWHSLACPRTEPRLSREHRERAPGTPKLPSQPRTPPQPQLYYPRPWLCLWCLIVTVPTAGVCSAAAVAGAGAWVERGGSVPQPCL